MNRNERSIIKNVNLIGECLLYIAVKMRKSKERSFLFIF